MLCRDCLVSILLCCQLRCPFDRPCLLFFFDDTATTEIYTLSLHDALPILALLAAATARLLDPAVLRYHPRPVFPIVNWLDRKSTRLNSSHITISYAVFCLKKKKQQKPDHREPQQAPAPQPRRSRARHTLAA